LGYPGESPSNFLICQVFPIGIFQFPLSFSSHKIAESKLINNNPDDATRKGQERHLNERTQKRTGAKCQKGIFQAEIDEKSDRDSRQQLTLNNVRRALPTIFCTFHSHRLESLCHQLMGLGEGVRAHRPLSLLPQNQFSLTPTTAPAAPSENAAGFPPGPRLRFAARPAPPR
jgi:hypothetical protein